LANYVRFGVIMTLRTVSRRTSGPFGLPDVERWVGRGPGSWVLGLGVLG